MIWQRQQQAANVAAGTARQRFQGRGRCTAPVYNSVIQLTFLCGLARRFSSWQDGNGDESCLRVEALSEKWIENTEEILTMAFSDAMGYLPAYKKLLQKQIGSYLVQHMKLPPLAVVLVAVLESGQQTDILDTIESGDEGPQSEADSSPVEPVEQGNAEPDEQPAPDTRLIGTLELSFKPATRTQYMTLNPPKVCVPTLRLGIASDWLFFGT